MPDSSTKAASLQEGATAEVAAPSLESTEEQEPLPTASVGSTTEPLGKGSNGSGPSTIPLPELAVEGLPTLDTGTIVAERYEVVSLIESRESSNLYNSTDLQGYRHCWACGSTNSMQGDIYCVDCGAQLAGRHYRLQEFLLPGGDSAEDPLATAIPLPAAIINNQVPGVARVFDALVKPEIGRAYVIWEEVYGRSLDSWLLDADSMGVAHPDSEPIARPDEEEALLLMSQAAEILAELHNAELYGCDLSLHNLIAQPGDRLIVLDPSACMAAEEAGDGEGDGQRQWAEDMRLLATELERWYLGVRSDTSELPTGLVEGPANSAALISSADDATGPLHGARGASITLSRARDGAYATAAEFAAALREAYEESRPPANLQLWSGCASDVGRVRNINEDSLLVVQATVMEHAGNTPAGLFVIADGMGGHQSGEIASSIAVRTIGSLVQSALLGPLLAGDPVAHDVNTCMNLLRQAVIEANHRITNLARERHSDLGTTVTAAILIGNQVAIANVGDSRTYHWGGGQVTPITRDHSLVAQLVAAGELAPDDIYTHPRRNEIYRALGDPRLTEAEVDVYSRRIQPGEGILLCSDGLWDFVRDPVITSIVEENSDTDPRTTARVLVDRANAAGGEDNITVIFVLALAS